MTPAQLDHLRKIDAHLERLLELAAKRTPGGWDTMGIAHSNCLRLFAGNDYLGIVGNSDAEKPKIQDDAAFIASCAGNAEAGWKATRAAIAAIEYYSIIDENLEAVLEAILAALPLESLEA